MEKKSFWVRLTEEYSESGFEDRVFPWCVGAVILLAAVYVVAIVIDPWNAIILPLVVFGGGMVLLLLMILACSGAMWVRKFVELVADQEFEGDR